MFPLIWIGIASAGSYFLGRHIGSKSAQRTVPGPIFVIRFKGITQAMTLQELIKALALKMGWKISDILDGDLNRDAGVATIAFATTVKNPPMPAAGTTFMAPETPTTPTLSPPLAPVTVLDVIQAPASTSGLGPSIFS